MKLILVKYRPPFCEHLILPLSPFFESIELWWLKTTVVLVVLQWLNRCNITLEFVQVRRHNKKKTRQGFWVVNLQRSQPTPWSSDCSSNYRVAVTYFHKSPYAWVFNSMSKMYIAISFAQFETTNGTSTLYRLSASGVRLAVYGWFIYNRVEEFGL